MGQSSPPFGLDSDDLCYHFDFIFFRHFETVFFMASHADAWAWGCDDEVLDCYGLMEEGKATYAIFKLGDHKNQV